MKIEVTLWIVVFVLVALAIVFPKTRPFSLSLIGVVIFAIVALIVVVKREDPLTPGVAPSPTVSREPVDFEQFHVAKLDKADPGAKSRIGTHEIRFDQIRVEDGAVRGSVNTIVARLYNDSATYTLTDYGYYLVVQDCIKAVCTTVFDQRGLSSTSVPPNQARDVQIAIRNGDARAVPSFKILGTPNVLLTPTETRAQAGSSSQKSE